MGWKTPPPPSAYRVKEALISDKCNVILGDFNFVEDRLDRNAKNATLKNDNVCQETWQEIKDTFSLIDTFRATKSSARRYSWIKPNKKAKSRIDRTYISNAEAGKVLKTSLLDTSLSDHKMVELKMSSETEKGPDQWAVNVSILNDHKFREMITNDWIEFQDYYDDFENLLDWWDAAKAMVRSVAMFYSQHKKSIENKLRNELKSERVRLEAVIECSPDENNIHTLRIINSRERDLEMKSIERHRIRARLPSFEDGEPNIFLCKNRKISSRAKFS